MNQISVIIPAFQEGDRIVPVLANVRAVLPGAEIIVSDGTRDVTTRKACSEAGVIYHQPSDFLRGAAMNSAAKVATGDLLLFLHADTTLPRQAEKLSTLDLARTGFGGFHKSFQPNGCLLRLHALTVNFWKLDLQREFLGDNAMFVRADLFKELGGFREIAMFEDLDLSRRLGEHCRGRGLGSRVIRSPTITSSRRFQKRGVISTLFFMQRCRSWYAAGIPTEVIAERYARLQ